MKMKWIVSVLLVLPFVAMAEEKECGVKGMHCDACTEMVQEKVCNDTYAECKVTLKDKKGLILLKTKDAAAKIDEKALAKTVADMGDKYKLEKCAAKKM